MTPSWGILVGKLYTEPHSTLDDCPLARMRQSLHREELIMSVQDRWIKETVDPIMDEAGTLIGGVHLDHRYYHR